MHESAANPITRLLVKAKGGDEPARRQLWSAIHDELRAMARRQMAEEGPGHTLQPTALVHEVYFRLFGANQGEWNDRRHFFGAAARAMRQIRVDDARKRGRLKRGGDRARERLGDVQALFDHDPLETLAVSEALDKLEAEDPRQAEVVMMRYFAGLTEEETAGALGVSRRTVQNDWHLARVWLHRELSRGDTDVPPS